MNRYLVAMIVSLGLIILLIVLLVGGGSKKSTLFPTKLLPAYANSNAVVRLTIDGPIVANQNHNYLQVTVGQNAVTYNLFQGYNNNVIVSKIYNNNLNSYRAFLYALYYAGFSEGNNNPKLSNSTGYCSIGDVFTFELIQNNHDIQKYWATNCSSTPKTFNGQLSSVVDLFKAQVPNYYQLTSKGNF
jgi:hypothetical protein